jgi:hypothetical protein
MDTQVKPPDESSLDRTPVFDKKESMNRAIEMRNISLRVDRPLGLAGRQYQLFERILENTVKIQEIMGLQNNDNSLILDWLKSKIEKKKEKEKDHKKKEKSISLSVIFGR